jgi:hypothetical protein
LSACDLWPPSTGPSIAPTHHHPHTPFLLLLPRPATCAYRWQRIPDLPPFAIGALCSNLAWLTVWPLDVVKSQVQSGHYQGQGLWKLLVGTARSGQLYRGLLPGLMRSTIANGCAMVAYTETKKVLEKQVGEGRSGTF